MPMTIQPWVLSLKDVANNPNRKCGHAFVLAMILTGVLQEVLV